MQIGYVVSGVKGWLCAADLALYWSMIGKTAEARHKILAFWERYGLAAAQEAFGVKRRTLYGWRLRLRQGGGQAIALRPMSTRPHRVRQRRWPSEIIEQIRQLRHAHPNLGKEKIYILLQPFCRQRKLRCPSERTIGRLIADAPDKMRLAPPRPTSRFFGPRAKPKRLRKPKGFLACAPGECVAWDSIQRTRDGVRRYLLTCTDLYSRFSFALAIKNLSSQRAKDALCVAQTLLPFPLRHALSDNGSEFAQHFDEALSAQQIPHWRTYPKSPKMNAHCERFNRTLNEEFIAYHEDDLFEDLPSFNDQLLDYLLWFNTQRPHLSLERQSPAQRLALNFPNLCKMSWPSTAA